MAKTTNIDLLIAVRDMLEDYAGSSIEFFYSAVPSSVNAEGLPEEFILVKSTAQNNPGNIKTYGTIEVCIYVRNLSNENDYSQPDLARLKTLTDIIYPILEDGVKYNTSIQNIKDTLINHSEIRYHYVSFVCETLSIN